MSEETQQPVADSVPPADGDVRRFGFSRGGLFVGITYGPADVTVRDDLADRELPASDPDSRRSFWARTVFWVLLAIVSIVAVRQGISVRQLIFQLALPIFFLAQLVHWTYGWLRQKDRLGRASGYLTSELLEYGGGFFGVVALLTFFYLEALDLLALWQDAPGVWSFISSLSLERIFLFGLDSLWNGMLGLFWPIYWFVQYGWGLVWPVLFVWLVYQASVAVIGPWAAVPEPSAVAEEPGGGGEVIEQPE